MIRTSIRTLLHGNDTSETHGLYLWHALVTNGRFAHDTIIAPHKALSFTTRITTKFYSATTVYIHNVLAFHIRLS